MSHRVNMLCLQRLLAVLALTPFLCACINDGAAYMIDGSGYALSIERKQDFFWEKQAKFSIIVSRLPDCQRKHAIHTAKPTAAIELWQPGQGTYILSLNNRNYVTETRTCKGFAELTEDPPGGLGTHLGTFAVKKGLFSFIPAPKETAPATEQAATPQ